MQSPVDGAAAANSTLLREQQAEREKLLMDNFNQALRINYLEERLLRVKQGTDFAGEDLESEIAQLRIALEEREHDIKQRNFAMIRATEAIDVLTAQLNAAKEENARLAAELEQGFSVKKKEKVDADLVDKWRRELERAVESEHAAAARARELESEIAQHQDTIASLMSKMKEMEESRSRAQQDAESTLELERRKVEQQLEISQAKASVELDHWRGLARQREEQLSSSKLQIESLMKEKEAMDARYQNKMKRMEEEVQTQLRQLREESDKYRAEHTRLLTDHQKTHFDRNRLAMETESVKQERTRLQSEIERLGNELQQMAGDAERFRLQNAKLEAQCEEQAKSIDSYREEKEKTAEMVHRLEGEVRQWRKSSAEHELAVKTLEVRVQQANEQIKSLDEQRQQAAARSQQSSNERLSALERERHAIEQDNQNLRAELVDFQHALDTLEQNFHACEDKLGEETAKSQEFQARVRDLEDELARKSADSQELERQLAEARVAASMTENAKLQQQNDTVARFTKEKSELLASLQQERRRAEAAERAQRDMETQHASLVKEMDAVAQELRYFVSADDQTRGRGPNSMALSVREAIAAVQREFKSDASRLQAQSQQQLNTMSAQLDRLSSRLQSSQSKLESLQFSTFHSKDEKRSVEQTWASRYEKLRVEKEAERREMQNELSRLQERLSVSENSLAQAKHDAEKLSRDRSTSRTEWERDYHDLKESNRLLYDELQERRRAAEHSRKQYMRAVRENKELLAAIDVYKKAIAERNADIEYYKGALMKYTQQLQRRVSMGEVKQTLLEQLEQTQFMINATYQRWSESDLAKGEDPAANAETAALAVQLDEYIGRMELVTERWNKFLAQSKELHKHYGDAWQSAMIRLSTGDVNRPRWVDDVERKCLRLLNESVRVSEVMRDTVSSVGDALQQEQEVHRHREKEHRLQSPHKSRRATDDWREVLGSPRHVSGPLVDNTYSSPIKKRPSSMAPNNNAVTSPSRRSSTKQLAARLGAGGVYNNSLSSLGRLGVELDNIERKIRGEHA